MSLINSTLLHIEVLTIENIYESLIAPTPDFCSGLKGQRPFWLRGIPSLLLLVFSLLEMRCRSRRRWLKHVVSIHRFNEVWKFSKLDVLYFPPSDVKVEVSQNII